ncbi:MAG TPA: ComEA family DNA-binding protein [Acidothermaceae bacterium]|jgi:competence protein ComEA|nr:ComEA family DNA-binding protein [Acidothermaceae bacterium]
MLRRGPDPLELAGVLDRLERLQVVPPAAGWLPSAHPDTEPDLPITPVAEPPAVQSARLSAGVRARAFDPGRRGVAVLAVLALCAAGGGAWYFVRAAPHAVSVDAADAAPDVADAADPTALLPSASAAASLGPAALSSPELAGSPSAGVSGAVVVDVVGKVLRPGVFTLPASSRIVDAIAAAGGARPGTDLTALDLASKLLDGEEIFVGIPPPSGATQTAGGVVGGSSAGGVGDAAGTTATVVDLNSATQAELETLPGVGAVTAQRILDWRTQHGRFASVSQLQQVSGIGPSKYAALAGRVKV